MHRWSKCLKFKRAFLGNLCIFVLFLLLRTTEIRKKCNNRIVKLFRKKRLGGGVCLSLVTRSLKRTHLASLSGSYSQFEILLMLIHLMPDSLSTFVLVTFFPTIKVHLFTNKNDELTFWRFGSGYLSERVTFLSLTFVEMSGVLILIKGKDFSAKSEVTLI